MRGKLTTLGDSFKNNRTYKRILLDLLKNLKHKGLIVDKNLETLFLWIPEGKEQGFNHKRTSKEQGVADKTAPVMRGVLILGGQIQRCINLI